MIQFLKNLFSKKTTYIDSKYSEYDETVYHLTDKELMISAKHANMLHDKAVKDVQIRNCKAVFRKIHGAIREGLLEVRLQSYEIKPGTLEYIESFGYQVRQIVPDSTTLATIPRIPVAVTFNDTDDDDTEEPPYHYYVVSWSTT